MRRSIFLFLGAFALSTIYGDAVSLKPEACNVIIVNATNHVLKQVLIVNDEERCEVSLQPGSAVAVRADEVCEEGRVRLRAHIPDGVNIATGRFLFARVLDDTIEVGMAQEKGDEVRAARFSDITVSLTVKRLKTIDVENVR